MSVEQVRRRFLVLTATRWLPTGILLPLVTVVPLQRGLSLAQVGVLVAVSGVVVLVLELPTGGLSDVLGRRPMLLVAAITSLVSTGVQVLATTFALYAAAWAVEGAYRALDSGPLESWYVDAALAADPRADLEHGLSRQGAVLAGAVALGALASGALALAPQPTFLPVLALPLLASFALRALDAVLLAVLLREEPRGRPSDRTTGRAASRRAALRSVLSESGATLVAALALLRHRRAVLALVLAEVTWGAGMVGVEVFTGPRLLDLLGGGSNPVLVLAVVTAASWALSGAGARAAPWLARRTGSWVAAAVLTRTVQGAAVLLAGVVAGLPGLLGAYVGFYLVHGAANVAHSGLLHRRVEAAQRATVVSVNSMASRLGGVVAAPLLGVLGTAAGLPWVFVAAAAALVAGAPLYLAARPSTRTGDRGARRGSGRRACGSSIGRGQGRRGRGRAAGRAPTEDVGHVMLS